MDSEKGRSELWELIGANLRNTFRRERGIDQGLGEAAHSCPEAKGDFGVRMALQSDPILG